MKNLLFALILTLGLSNSIQAHTDQDHWGENKPSDESQRIEANIDRVLKERRRIFNVTDRWVNLKASCINIFNIDDITYLVFEIENRSGLTFKLDYAGFIINSEIKPQRSVQFEEQRFPIATSSVLSCHPGEKIRVAFAFRKLTLPKMNTFLNVHFDENDSYRGMNLKIKNREINKADKK